ncbi:MAG: tRNA (adenosine(37)-N6)-threonylcarbamoyltransferase complex ATPase subunit type 1 TsaE [Lautropia sp.]
MITRRWPLADVAATERFGAALARALAAEPLSEQAFVIHLSGDLGAGKTTLARAILRGTGVTGPVKSPTFTLLEPYNSPSSPIYHFDLYRFSSPDQWFDAGFEDIISGPGLVLVEWPENAAGALPPPDLRARLEPLGEDDGRCIELAAGTAAGARCLSALRYPAGDDAC